MRTIRPRPQLAALALLVLLPSSAAAQTVWVVDGAAGSGFDFTTVQEAVHAASPGDRIDVRPGVYATFVVDKGVTIMGTPTFDVFGRATFEDVPAGETAVLADCNVAFRTSMDRCTGTVLIDACDVHELVIWDSEDVRLQSCPNIVGAEVRRSSVQFIDCGISARSGFGDDGTPGLSVTQGRVVVTGGSIAGGNGVSPAPPLYASGSGGPGVSLAASSGWFLDTACIGGWGGDSSQPNGASVELGAGSEMLEARSSMPFGITAPAGGVSTQHDFPSLVLTGTGSAPGDTAVFRARAGAGTSARIWAGRFAASDPLGSGIDLPWYHTHERGASLGAMSASGVRDVPFVVPPLARGTLVFGQVGRTRADGETQLSGAVVVVVR